MQVVSKLQVDEDYQKKISTLVRYFYSISNQWHFVSLEEVKKSPERALSSVKQEPARAHQERDDEGPDSEEVSETPAVKQHTEMDQFRGQNKVAIRGRCGEHGGTERRSVRCPIS